MYLSSEDARSDVILVGAATVFGAAFLQILLSAPGAPTGELGTAIVMLVAWFALSGLTPLLLARHRRDVHQAFALGPDVAPGPALLLAVPLVVVGAGRQLLVDGSVLTAALGRIGRIAFASPVVGATSIDAVGAVLTVFQIGVLTTGSLLLVSFLTTRGDAAFRADDRPARQSLRVLGFGAAGLAVATGVSDALARGGAVVPVLLHAAVLAAIVVVADRLTGPTAVVSRPAVLTPAVVILVAHLFASGGLLGGGLIRGLSTGSLAAGVTVVAAVTISHRRRALAVLPLLLAIQWWPTCLGPLPFALVGC